MLDKIKELGIDLFILIVDNYHNKYKVKDYMAHANYDSFKLVFTFEDWTGIINDGKKHIYIIAEYVNADNQVLVKHQSEDFDELLQKVKKWNELHRIS